MLEGTAGVVDEFMQYKNDAFSVGLHKINSLLKNCQNRAIFLTLVGLLSIANSP